MHPIVERLALVPTYLYRLLGYMKAGFGAHPCTYFINMLQKRPASGPSMFIRLECRLERDESHAELPHFCICDACVQLLEGGRSACLYLQIHTVQNNSNQNISTAGLIFQESLV